MPAVTTTSATATAITTVAVLVRRPGGGGGPWYGSCGGGGKDCAMRASVGVGGSSGGVYLQRHHQGCEGEQGRHVELEHLLPRLEDRLDALQGLLGSGRVGQPHH